MSTKCSRELLERRCEREIVWFKEEQFLVVMPTCSNRGSSTGCLKEKELKSSVPSGLREEELFSLERLTQTNKFSKGPLQTH